MKRFLFITGFLFVYQLSAMAQTAVIAQLSRGLNAAGSDEERLEKLLRLCEEHESLHKDSLYKYALRAVQLASAQSNQRRKSLAQVAFIYASLRYGKTDTALALIESEIQKNPVKSEDIRAIYFTLAAQKVDCFGDVSNYKDALSELYHIIAEAEEYGDSMVLAKNMNTLGVIQYNLDHVSQAFNWYFKALTFTSATPKFDEPVAALYINLAETYRWTGRIDSADHYAGKAILLCERAQNLFFLANAIRVKGSIFKQKKDYVSAERYMLKCIEIRNQLEGKLLFTNEQLALANIYTSAHEPDKAIAVLTASLAQNPPENKVDPLVISYYKSLASCYKQKGDDTAYQQTLEKLIVAKDAFYEENSAHAIAELQTKYEVQKKESTIIRQKLDLTQKNYLFYGSLIFLLFTAVVGWLLFKNYRRKQVLVMDKVVYEEKLLSRLAVKEAEENERKRIAADLHDNLGAYAASIVSNLDQIAMQEVNEAAAVPLQELRNNSQSIVAQLGDSIWALKKDVLSLTAISDRLKAFIHRIQPSYPAVQIDVEEHIDSDGLLPPSQAFHLFSILQEAIINALKHSRCTKIQVSVLCKANWQISVADNGKGIDPELIKSSNNGLSNMQRRAAEFGWAIGWHKEQPGTSVRISQATTD